MRSATGNSIVHLMTGDQSRPRIRRRKHDLDAAHRPTAMAPPAGACSRASDPKKHYAETAARFG